MLDGATVVDVARRNGVARQTVHDWLRRYAAGGMAGLADRSSRPASCPHQMAPAVEARIVELRRANPGWGPRSLLHRLAREGIEPLPGRSAVHRALLRHGLIDATRRRRRRSDYRRWERSRAMELWQMDVVEVDVVELEIHPGEVSAPLEDAGDEAQRPTKPTLTPQARNGSVFRQSKAPADGPRRGRWRGGNVASLECSDRLASIWDGCPLPVGRRAGFGACRAAAGVLGAAVSG